MPVFQFLAIPALKDNDEQDNIGWGDTLGLFGCGGRLKN